MINSDAWVVGDAVERLVAFADEHPDAAVVGPRLRNPDGSLQRSVRGFPTPWRLATEYFFLRKLAPRSRALERVLRRRLRPRRGARGRVGDGRRAFSSAARRSTQVGLFDEDFFLFSEETDWFYRFHQAGWKIWFLPEAEVVHVGGASHGGRMFNENVRGHVRFFAKHHGDRAGRARAAAARSSLAGCAGLLFRGERGRMYRDAARSLVSRRDPRGSCAALPALGARAALPRRRAGASGLRLAAATACLLLPARSSRVRCASPGFSRRAWRGASPRCSSR